MNRMQLIAGLAASIMFVAGCSSVSLADHEPASAAAQAAPAAAVQKQGGNRLIVNDGAGSVVVQKVEARSGVSSVTVEKLAKSAGCTGGSGAGRITEKGPIEIYRMQCDNGAVFTARCELRQCKPMR